MIGTISAGVKKIVESLGQLPQPVSHPALVLVSGLPGSGKSYFSRALAQRAGMTMVQSDAVRKLLFPRPIYDSNESYRVFLRCHDVIEYLLNLGLNVIFDATNLRERNRKYIYTIAKATGAKLIIVWVEAPPDVVFQRMKARAADRDPLDMSDATWKIYQELAATTQRINRQHYVVNTSGDIGPALEEIEREVKRPPVHETRPKKGVSSAGNKRKHS